MAVTEFDPNNENFKRFNDHLAKIRLQLDHVADDNRMIKTALIGDEFNQETGLVHRVKNISDKVENLIEKDHKNSVYINQLKFIVGIISTIIIGFMFNLIFKK